MCVLVPDPTIPVSILTRPACLTRLFQAFDLAVVSVAPQVLASLGHRFSLPTGTVLHKLERFFKATLGFHAVVDTVTAASIALVEVSSRGHNPPIAGLSRVPCATLHRQAKSS